MKIESVLSVIVVLMLACYVLRKDCKYKVNEFLNDRAGLDLPVSDDRDIQGSSKNKCGCKKTGNPKRPSCTPYIINEDQLTR